MRASAVDLVVKGSAVVVFDVVVDDLVAVGKEDDEGQAAVAVGKADDEGQAAVVVELYAAADGLAGVSFDLCWKGKNNYMKYKEIVECLKGLSLEIFWDLLGLYRKLWI